MICVVFSFSTVYNIQLSAPRCKINSNSSVWLTVTHRFWMSNISRNEEFCIFSTISQGYYVLWQSHEWCFAAPSSRGSQSLCTWSKPTTASSHIWAHGKTSAMQQGTWNTPYRLQNTFQSKLLCNTLLELNSMTLVQIMWAKKKTCSKLFQWKLWPEYAHMLV